MRMTGPWVHIVVALAEVVAIKAYIPALRMIIMTDSRGYRVH